MKHIVLWLAVLTGFVIFGPIGALLAALVWWFANKDAKPQDSQK